mmetsp:Transcript_29829/g.46555  ORF Transcript_29829/g.46555 Transcript_29829/m.46555 type:complete len:251 (+) Transcript_29829:80-832(+)
MPTLGTALLSLFGLSRPPLPDLHASSAATSDLAVGATSTLTILPTVGAALTCSSSAVALSSFIALLHSSPSLSRSTDAATEILLLTCGAARTVGAAFLHVGTPPRTVTAEASVVGLHADATASACAFGGEAASICSALDGAATTALFLAKAEPLCSTLNSAIGARDLGGSEFSRSGCGGGGSKSKALSSQQKETALACGLDLLAAVLCQSRGTPMGNGTEFIAMRSHPQTSIAMISLTALFKCTQQKTTS